MTQAPISLKRSSTLPSSKPLASPALKLLGGSERTLGNMKRTVPSVRASMERVNVVHAVAIHEPKNIVKMPSPELARKFRRVGLSGAFAAGFGGGGGGAAATAVALVAGGLTPSG